MQQNNLHEIQKRLSSVIVKEHRRDSLKGLYIFIPLVSAALILFSIIEAVGENNFFVRGIMFYLLLIVSSLSFIKLILLPVLKSYGVFSKPDSFAAAEKVGNAFPEIKDELLNALQLVSLTQNNYSSQLIEAAFQRVFGKTKNYNFSSVINFTSTKKFLRIALASILVTILLFVTVPGLSYASFRIFNYGKSFTPPQKFIFEITPGNAEITKGDNVRIRIKVIGNAPKDISFLTKAEEQTDFSEKTLHADSTGAFTFEAVAVKSSFEYYASAEGIKSESYKISVINRPFITSFEVKVISPSYSQLPEQLLQDNGNITALLGSTVKISLTSSRELSKAIINFGDSTFQKMEPLGTRAVCSFSVKKEANYQMSITDIQGFSNINPISYSIKIIPDSAPSIEMVSPNDNVKLGKDNKISLVSKISDDYGFTKMTLNYRLAASKYRKTSDEFTPVPITISPKQKEQEVYFVWDLTPLVLAEGEVLSYYLEVFDNDNVSGPKSAKTQQYTITVPSMDELFASAENKQDDAMKDLSETLKDASNLNKEMQQITDDLRQNSQEISWQEKERIQKAQDKFKEINKKVADISQKLNEMKNDLAQNNLLSEETMKKYDELQKLLDQFTSDELKKAFEKMQDALQKMMRDNVQMSMEDLKTNEDYLRKSLERTLNLLKRIQVEQKIDEMQKRIEELTKKIEELKNKTEQSSLLDQQKRNELTNRQKDVTNELNTMKDEMEKLGQKMGELSDMPKDLMDKLQQEFDKQQNQNLSKDAENKLQQQMKQMAMQNQDQLSQNMQSMSKQFKNMQSAMQQMNQMKTFADMMKIMNDLISLSKDQENLKDSSEQLSPYSEDFQNKERQQNEIQNNLGKILKNMSALSQKTFAVTPEMGKALGKSMSQMQQSMSALHNKNGQYAAQQQRGAMASLNEAANMVKAGMNQLMNGGQGGGMMGLMQQLQQLGQQQMGLNQLTQMLNQGKLSQETMAQMQRLAQQQEMIRKSLEQLNEEAKESGQSKRLAANLDKILDEMREVVTNLETEKLNNDLVKQQQRILSKLLDAQKSINERDYEEKRKSTAGKDFDRTSPPELMLSTDEGKNKLRDELMKAVKEGYKKDYEELIRKYFDALQNEQKKN